MVIILRTVKTPNKATETTTPPCRKANGSPKHLRMKRMLTFELKVMPVGIDDGGWIHPLPTMMFIVIRKVDIALSSFSPSSFEDSP